MISAIRHYADVITSVFGHLLKRGTDQAVVATLRVDLDNHADDASAQRLFVHVLCSAPSAYVNVFVAYSSRPASGDLRSLAWRKVCSHDSAWREDGVRAALKSSVAAFAAIVREQPTTAEWHEYLHLDHLSVVPVNQLLNEQIAHLEPAPLDARTALRACLSTTPSSADV